MQFNKVSVPFMTGVAGEGPEVAVYELVLLEGVGLSEGGAALVTRVRVRARVRRHVAYHLTYTELQNSYEKKINMLKAMILKVAGKTAQCSARVFKPVERFN